MDAAHVTRLLRPPFPVRVVGSAGRKAVNVELDNLQVLQEAMQFFGQCFTPFVSQGGIRFSGYSYSSRRSFGTRPVPLHVSHPMVRGMPRARSKRDFPSRSRGASAVLCTTELFSSQSGHRSVRSSRPGKLALRSAFDGLAPWWLGMGGDSRGRATWLRFRVGLLPTPGV